ncbi:MAG: phage late control D family protein [Treponema sp.]|jgi:uncharacterized protein involved in type VI secretion and phage assembly|nr:phage late control D family protein [Treponema sp.]
MADNITSMTMHFAGGGFEDLYPWELVLEEGFSQTYRGKLTALSKKKRNMKELSGLLDKGISLTMTQKLGDAKTRRTRYLHGIVTEITNDGVFSNGTAADCYRYVFVVEPELVRLKHTRLSASYYQMNPPDIFEAILNKYKIKSRIEEKYCSRRIYGKHLCFEQSMMSDFDMIDSIARMYGISFMFTHPKTAENSLGGAELYFSDGERFPLSPVVYSDKREEPVSAAFDFLSADEGKSVWRMDRWAVTRSIGVDGFKVSAVYPNADYGSDQWKWGGTEPGARHIHRNGLFHTYDRDAQPAEVDDDIRLILAARRMETEREKALWTAGTTAMSFRPGLVLELRHFYGMKDSEVMTAMVTHTTLRHRTVWPVELAARTESVAGEITEVRGSCLEWGSGAERRFCPLSADSKRAGSLS